MNKLSRLQKIGTAFIGIGAGIGFYIYNQKDEKNILVHNSWTTNTIVSPCAKWDPNWDHRDPKSLVKPLSKDANIEEQKKYNQKIDSLKPKVMKHIFLIRHGQYEVKGATDSLRVLTELGRKQAAYTGERLKTLELPWTEVIWSTMTRAQETGKIISNSLTTGCSVANCSLIEEGAPIAPEPAIGHWRPEPYFFQDGSRIEAAFRKYFHRADPTQEKDSYSLIVCHANVIRYFTCRALQIPPEAWLRLSLNHASITWISIYPTGRVILHTLGDSGHIPAEFLTYR